MAKNIVVFSDGTGQRSGEHFDETRTNVYKLYRACRCGPDSSVDPNEQFAFYDPGIGTLPPKLGVIGTAFAWVYNVVCQATGLGLTRNIEDCYAAIVKVWEPGDRIFLFGFSRGAYTVRCLASVLKYCGIPTMSPDRAPLEKSDAALKRLAREAVEQVYQHVGRERRSNDGSERLVEQRHLLADRFRRHWASADANVHFIGVFDTVAAVANLVSLLTSALIACSGVAAAAMALSLIWGSFTLWAGIVAVTALVFAGGWYLKTHVKVAWNLPGHPWWTTLHVNPVRMRFYDTTLDPRVGWARHALAIDERRADFDRVTWGNAADMRVVGPGEPDWMKQIWFAGNHADIGGGYAEPESRLSDAALNWMVAEATNPAIGLAVDGRVLRGWPAANGIQHDETKRFPFKYGTKIWRRIPSDAQLDPIVLERLALERVRHLDVDAPYRPENLRDHVVAGAVFMSSPVLDARA